MPSSEECLEAREQIRKEAIQQLLKEGHLLVSAQEIARRMKYEEQIEYAEKFRGKSIYRGPYSPY